MDARTGDRSILGLEYEFTLQEVFDSIDSRTLNALTTGNFSGTQKVKIKKNKTKVSQFAEDALISKPIKRKRVRKQKYSKQIPSKEYASDVSEYLSGEVEAKAETVLGFYFTTYKKYFHEEDPDWSGKSLNQAKTLINKMAAEVTDSNFKPLVIFVRKIMPLWFRQLKQGAKFPNSRPTLQSLFGGKRHFWANRKLYFKQWQQTK